MWNILKIDDIFLEEKKNRIFKMNVAQNDNYDGDVGNFHDNDEQNDLPTWLGFYLSKYIVDP